MIDTVFIRQDHIHQKPCQIISIGRRSELVIHHCEMIMGLAQIQHGLDEVLAVDSEYPGDSYDKIFLQCLLYCQFSFVFGLSVYIQRMTLVLWLPGSGALAVKHIIGTDIDHLAVQLLADIRNVLCAVRIDLTADFHVILRCIHCGIGCTVYHSVRCRLSDHLFHAGRICDIHLLNIHADSLNSALCQLIYHIISQLAFYACYQDFHRLPSFSFLCLWHRSLNRPHT